MVRLDHTQRAEGGPDCLRPMIGNAIARVLIFILIAFGALVHSVDARAQDALRPLPPMLRVISDEVEALSVSEGEALARIVADVRQESGVRIIIAIVETTAPESIESYTQRLRAHWGSQRPTLDGEEDLFIVIAATDRALRIAAGLNMTTIVERLSSNTVMRDIGPLLRSGKYFPALALIVNRLLLEIRSEPYAGKKSRI